jgi:rare lipoprotein A
MPSVSHAGMSGVFVDALRSVIIVNRRNIVRAIGLTLAAASLAGCAQSSVVSRNSAFMPSTRQAAVEHHRETRLAAHEPVSVVRRQPSSESGAGTKSASAGLASFYSEGNSTASGEKFDPNELTAAHPSLPFGTKLRVTNTTTGKSVTVRVNDRGPYVPGRVVDVSYSAAQALGMVNAGTASVKLDVVR